jgi:putative CRISPR-associated protein (TIGR02619 family)
MKSPPLPKTLLCTVGTSLFKPNLSGLPKPESYEEWLKRQPPSDQSHLLPEFISRLKTDFTQKDWQALSQLLTQLPPSTRLCGAEINSIHDLIERGYCAKDMALVFCHSATPDGEQIATILETYYHLQGYKVDLKNIEDLQDSNPKLFKSKGLRNLTKTISQVIWEQGSQYCAINATGGYKAQIAIAVLMGQALGVPVYYKHEQFSEIIEFPPMPVSLDFGLWLEKSGLLTALDCPDMVNQKDVEDDLDERVEALINREIIDGTTYLELSPTGQIFHETFKGRFASDRDRVLPPAIPSPQKVQPALTDHSWRNARPVILSYLQKITDQCSYVRQCRTHYWNPDLSSPVRFRIQGEQIEGIFSDGSWTVKFYVDTSAQTHGQRAACIADLNGQTF